MASGEYDDGVADPHALASLNPRGRDALAAAAQAVQANVVALRVAWCRRAGLDPIEHDIKTPPPGPVREARELLIDRHVIKDYSLDEVTLRLRQVWGEFSVLCWLFHHEDPQHPPPFCKLPRDQPMRCPPHIHAKLVEVQAGLWRIVHEQRARNDKDAKNDPSFRREHEIALSRPVRIGGMDVRMCNDEDLFCFACEYAGMLAAVRWAIDDRWEWEGPGIMEVALDDVS